MDPIRIRGARTHNLKNIDLDLPRHRLVVITGPSGSGKSSLAFDTLYAEGQRRYVESLSTYARQFLQIMDKPEVDLIEGLSPAISIEQRAAGHNPRSTVGTVTEIHDYLRLLYARAGTPYCPNHPEQPLAAQSVSQMVDATLAMPEGARLMILAPVVADRKGEHADLFEDLRARGFVRVRIRSEHVGADRPAAERPAARAAGVDRTGERARVYELDDLPALDRNRRHTIEVVVDRVKAAPGIGQRLAESFETALGLADGRAVVADMDSGAEVAFSNKFACPSCGLALPELEPRVFSFNNPAGACPGCDGLGHTTFFDPRRVVRFPDLSLASGAIHGWDRRNAFAFALIESLAAYLEFDVDTPWNELPENVRDLILNGSGTRPIPFSYPGERGGKMVREHAFEGVLPNFARRARETESVQVREELAKLTSQRTCPECQGTRLRREARHVRVGPAGEDRTISEVEGWSLSHCQRWFEQLALPGAKRAIGERIVREIANRLQFLNDVGLQYLALDRAADTLSGGEAQRIRLASQIGSGLSGVMYVLDEPSIGLHQRDNDRLIGTLKRLRDLGNSVIVVEHDEDMMRAADWLVDMGPAAGAGGGQVIAQGAPGAVEADQASLTGRYLAGALSIAVPRERRRASEDGWLVVRGARGNNLKSVELRLPVGLLTCVTGVSGSGKSTLINDTLHPAVARHLYRSQAEPAPHDAIEGLEHFDKVVDVDQSPIGRTPRSNPATYTGMFGPIRELFAETPIARERGYEPGRFSFNVKGGRCEACEGDGVIKVEMHFLPDVYVPCDVCRGARYNRETLEVVYKGRSIAQVLDMTVQQAAEFFSAVPAVARKLQTLSEVGLSYIRLGQAATTLSGGEAQRVKLSQELSKRDTGRTLYILDEPTTGLHFADIALLLSVLHQLRDNGNTVVVIEHNLDVIKTADWVIDLGPEGGAGGGAIVAQGTPEEVAASAQSYTGQYLRGLLAESLVQTVPPAVQGNSSPDRGGRPSRRPISRSNASQSARPRRSAK